VSDACNVAQRAVISRPVFRPVDLATVHLDTSLETHNGTQILEARFRHKTALGERWTPRPASSQRRFVHPIRLDRLQTPHSGPPAPSPPSAGEGGRREALRGGPEGRHAMAARLDGRATRLLRGPRRDGRPHFPSSRAPRDPFARLPIHLVTKQNWTMSTNRYSEKLFSVTTYFCEWPDRNLKQG
jgi:hypothetical protein